MPSISCAALVGGTCAAVLAQELLSSRAAVHCPDRLHTLCVAADRYTPSLLPCSPCLPRCHGGRLPQANSCQQGHPHLSGRLVLERAAAQKGGCCLLLACFGRWIHIGRLEQVLWIAPASPLSAYEQCGTPGRFLAPPADLRGLASPPLQALKGATEEYNQILDVMARYAGAGGLLRFWLLAKASVHSSRRTGRLQLQQGPVL